jgi:hypothetical protein
MPPSDRTRRRATLYAALGFPSLPTEGHAQTPEIAAFQRWMMTWRGIGDIVTGMERQGYALSLRKLVDDGWDAAFEEHRLLAPAVCQDRFLRRRKSWSRNLGTRARRHGRLRAVREGARDRAVGSAVDAGPHVAQVQRRAREDGHLLKHNAVREPRVLRQAVIAQVVARAGD